MDGWIQPTREPTGRGGVARSPRRTSLRICRPTSRRANTVRVAPISPTVTVFARLLIGMQMGNLVRRGERATAPRPVGSGVGWIHRFIVVHRGNRGAGHGVPIRISPCVRPICCEPVDSTHPDTQGHDAHEADNHEADAKSDVQSRVGQYQLLIPHGGSIAARPSFQLQCASPLLLVVWPIVREPPP